MPTFMTSDHWSVPPVMVAFTFTKNFAAFVGRGKDTEYAELFPVGAVTVDSMGLKFPFFFPAAVF